jgi:hypothetical protein
MDKNKISIEVDSWIAEKDIPQSACLKVVRTSARYFDPCDGEDDDEREAYYEYRWWYLTKDHEIIMDLPVKKDNFWIPYEKDDAISFPFSSIDFRRKYPFNKEQFRLKKIYERAKDLAQTHCSIRNAQGKENCRMRFESLIRRELRERIKRISLRLFRYQRTEKRGVPIAEEGRIDKVKEAEKMWKLHLAIEKCREIWSKHAYNDD